jgi:hypothetical protein
MKPYGYKKSKKIKGDGCFLCTKERKTTKKANRRKAKDKARDEVDVLVRSRLAARDGRGS